MEKLSRLLLFFFSLSIISTLSAQKRIVIMGSSTAAGSMATVYDSSWGGKLALHYKKNTTDGKDTIVTNLGYPGHTTYHEMPTDFVPPAGRPLPQADFNITKALSFNPDIVIISLPTNDIAAGFLKKEYMSNLRILYQLVKAKGATCYITTSQPRDDVSIARHDSLYSLVDSINRNFGSFVINFWDDLATSGHHIKHEVTHGDSIHINNLGHRYLFQRVANKQLFTANIVLPLALVDFRSVVSANNIARQWHTCGEGPNSFFDIERGSDSQTFQSLHRMQAIGSGADASYNWTDASPLHGPNYYRLKITENNKITYSKIIGISSSKEPLNVYRIFKPNPTTLLVDVGAQQNQQALIFIITAHGQVVSRWSQYIINPSSRINIPIGGLPKGTYFLYVEIKGRRVVKGFNL